MAFLVAPDVVLDGLLLATSCAHVLLAPYTKVEESFNLHAIHDVFFFGTDINAYDHVVHPGPVPRTFLAAAGVGAALRPITRILGDAGYLPRKSDVQIIARLLLAALACAPLMLLRRAVQREFGRLTSLFFVLVCATQFHMLFWMSRTVPNTYAFVLTTIATALLLGRSSNKRTRRAIALLTAGGILFRAELALLLAPSTIQALASGRISLRQAISTGIPFHKFLGAAPVWPELASMYYNVVLGRSTDWGTSPATHYLLALGPKLLTAYPLAAPALLDYRIRALLFPHIAFVTLMSLLAHKEWRFVIYIFPAVNVAAARTLRELVSRPKNPYLGRLMFLGAFCAIGLNLLCTIFVFAPSAIHNYPGGVALARLHELVGDNAVAHVHISNYAAQTGATLFSHERAPPYPDWMDEDALPKHPWIYDKTEGLTLAALTRDTRITHVIAEEAPPSWQAASKASLDNNAPTASQLVRNIFSPQVDGVSAAWEVLDVVEAFDRWEFSLDRLREPWTIMQMRMAPKLWILQRR
ncbi:Alg9-like mannosyltransferase family-domain-containing protein [Schizophyllum fasciatum]